MVEESKSSNRTLIIALAVAALVLALAAGIAVAAVVLRGDSDEGAEAAASATIMPDDTFMFASFNPHLDEAANFEVIEETWGDNPVVQLALGEMLGSIEKEGFSYKDDIEPWLGSEISFGMLGGLAELMSQGVETSFSGLLGQAPLTGEMPEIPQFTIAIATKDKGASDEFLDKIRAKAGEEGADWKETVYQDIEIVYAEPESAEEPGVAYATIDGFVVLAIGGLEPMQAFIDAQEGAKLADNQDYKDVMAKLPADQIGYGYIDVGAFMDAALGAVESELAGIAPGLLNLQQYEAFRGAGYSVGFEPNGLRVDFALVYDKDALPEDLPGAQAIDDEAAARVPASTLLFVSGTGLSSVFQGALDAIKAMPDQSEDLDEQLQMMTAMLGFSVEDLIEMLSGEFGVAVTYDPAGIGGDPSVPMGVSFLVEAKEEEQFRDLLKSVSMLLTLGAEMELPHETVSGVDVTVIADPSTGNMVAGWGVGNGFFVVATSEELLEAAFDEAGEKLTNAATYDEAVAPLPDPRAGLFYLNLEDLLGIVVETMKPAERESFDQARPLLEPIKAISAAAEPFDKGQDSMSGTFFILIGDE